MSIQSLLDTVYRHTIQRVTDSIRVGGIVAARSPKWPTFRRQFLATHAACEACGITNNLEVHHVVAFHEHPELELDVSNVMTLCEQTGGEECHLNVGHRFGTMTKGNWKVNNPNAREDARALRSRI